MHLIAKYNEQIVGEKLTRIPFQYMPSSVTGTSLVRAIR